MSAALGVVIGAVLVVVGAAVGTGWSCGSSRDAADSTRRYRPPKILPQAYPMPRTTAVKMARAVILRTITMAVFFVGWWCAVAYLAVAWLVARRGGVKTQSGPPTPKVKAGRGALSN
jgi:hypothetical protein